jgi:hypothetical protein
LDQLCGNQRLLCTHKASQYMNKNASKEQDLASCFTFWVKTRSRCTRLPSSNTILWSRPCCLAKVTRNKSTTAPQAANKSQPTLQS